MTTPSSVAKPPRVCEAYSFAHPGLPGLPFRLEKFSGPSCWDVITVITTDVSVKRKCYAVSRLRLWCGRDSPEDSTVAIECRIEQVNPYRPESLDQAGASAPHVLDLPGPQVIGVRSEAMFEIPPAVVMGDDDN